MYRLLERGDLSAVKVGGQWRFRKAAVDEWLDVTMQRLDADSLQALEGDAEVGPGIPRLADLIAPENARIVVPAGSQEAVIRAFAGAVQFPEGVAPELVCERVLERERLCSTALSGGVALLHTARTRPRVLREHDVVAIGRVESPVEFGALDGSVTDTLILLLGRSERSQLALLAKLTRLCQEPGFLASLRAAKDAAQVIALVRDTASRLFVATV
ncbi:MAG: hypothetical protein B7Z72_01660 [Gemmatimonadetes bacterium 21-71-4]|nr:MAG: hypothetical protein B7Z72_01660 [Gemmatimonadetes bacterium 21-71-4]